ncbi:MAG TPA: PhnD/SsuA/transferrin family substrate-binding protein [Gallionellaceae bacterium]|nr:PhnD/SsuA/transferrin family substrate-binding protein [Gallionellaceae bacterium]HQS75238.1 PhnD/SsuA/transferrin family substrate-binding protein [Gallionellaceae bacterium]
MARMIQFKALAAALLAMFAYGVCASERNPGIEIGIAPFLPVKTLVQNYAPLREYLQNRLHEPVTIVSAPDYKTYSKCIQNRDYPIIIATANSAYLAWSDSEYIPLLQPLIYTRPVVVIAKDQELKQLSDLHGKTISMPDILAVVSMQGLQMLSEAGLVPERNVFIKNMQNHSAAVNLVITGESTAAIVSDRALLQMPPSTREKIKIAHTWEIGAAPGIVYLGSPDLPHDKLELISKAIYEFAQNTPEGKKMMKDIGYDGLIPMRPEELRPLAPYGALLKKAMANNP